jgi:hypothetical protein
MESSLAAVTVNVVLPLMVPLVAEIAVVPGATATARPAFEIVAVAAVADAHVTVLDTSIVVLSLNVPVATNCCWAPFAIDGNEGVTAIDISFLTGVGVGAPPQPATRPTAATIESARQARVSDRIIILLILGFKFTVTAP